MVYTSAINILPKTSIKSESSLAHNINIIHIMCAKFDINITYILYKVSNQIYTDHFKGADTT